MATNAPAAAPVGDEPDVPEGAKCFVCLDEAHETNEPLIAHVCMCRQMHVHHRCLEQYLNAPARMALPMEERLACSICLQRYRVTSKRKVAKADAAPAFLWSRVNKTNLMLGMLIMVGPAILIAVISSAETTLWASFFLVVGAILIASLGGFTACWALCVPQFTSEEDERRTAHAHGLISIQVVDQAPPQLSEAAEGSSADVPSGSPGGRFAADAVLAVDDETPTPTAASSPSAVQVSVVAAAARSSAQREAGEQAPPAVPDGTVIPV